MEKYTFSWNLIGDVNLGRPNLGLNMEVDVYRLMQYTLRDTVEKKLGTEETDKIFFNAGKLAGTHFFEHFLVPVETLEEMASKLQRILKEKGIGILKIEEINQETGEIFLTIDEDLDCSGLPVLNYETCIYDEGFIAGIFESFTEREWNVKEIDCWCTGDRTCRFKAAQK